MVTHPEVDQRIALALRVEREALIPA